MSASRSMAYATILTVAAIVPLSSQAPFRSGRTVVSVNVSVREKNAPLPGLTAADFGLTDNGAVQTIEAVAMETVPIDLTLVLDTSGSTGTGLRRQVAEATAIAARLGPADRFRLLAIDTYVHELRAMQPTRSPWPARIPFNGASAVYDALFAGLVTPVATDRRHLLVALTDGMDTTSAVDATTVRDAADRSDVLMHIVAVTFDAGPAPVPPNWLPRRDTDLDVLQDAARRTGGDLHLAGPLGPDALRVFHSAFDDFRSSYVLRYSTGVPSPGWHKLEVRLKRRGSFTIRARRGYFAN